MNQSLFPGKSQPAVEAFLELKNISKRFGDALAVDDISLSIRRGEIICLVGQSGCGKSSLLRIIAGVDRPDTGRLSLDGVEIADPDKYMEPEERRIGLIFQDCALFPHLNVTNNIMFGLKKLAHTEARIRCEETIERFHLQNLAHRFPHMLSGGEHQRVALARALAPAPHVLLMDEPFSNLDRNLREEVHDEALAHLRELGTTVIIVTHDPEEALSTGDRVALMNSGRLVQVGSGSEIYDRPSSAYAAEFFCTFNKIPGIRSGDFIETPLGRFRASAQANNGAAVLYLRPQSLKIVAQGGIAGRVVESALLGEIEQIKVEVDSLPEPLRIRSTERRKFSQGEKIFLSIDPKEVFVF